MKTVACFGSGSGHSGEIMYETMREIGRRLAEYGMRVVTGGYGGSGMEAPMRGAQEANGNTVGYVLAGRPKKPNRFLGSIVVCGRDVKVEPNNDAMQYCIRLGFLLQADGFVVDPTDTTPGTLIEFLSVVNLNEKFWRAKPRPIVVIGNPRETLLFMHGIRTLPVQTFIKITTSPEIAAEWLIHELV